MSDKADLVNQWLKKAEHDPGIAKPAIDNDTEYRDIICFHC